MFLLYHLQTV